MLCPYADKIEKGGAGVTIEGLREFVKVGNRFMEQYNKSMLDDALLVQIQADNYGLNLENILPPSMMGTLRDLGKLETEQDGQAIQYNSIEEYYIQNPDRQKNLEQMITDNPDLTDEEILEILNTGPGDFSQVGGDTKKIAEAIGQFESGGNYKAIGKETGKGRAYGKYQVMSFNISNWTKEALGKSMTPKQFLNSPQSQDRVAMYKMDQYLKKYKTVEDVASVWFSGRPLAKAGNAKDILGTTVPQYVKNIRAIYNRLS